ncbi:MAG: DUF2333 family protein [Magnetococcales bacterium]|nr:DUF2333 family protein [Magnetococcales bacterium]
MTDDVVENNSPAKASRLLDAVPVLRNKSPRWQYGGGGLIVLLLVALFLSIYWSLEPSHFDVREATQQRLGKDADKVIGAVTINTVITIGETLLHKPGGYLSNDLMPPGLFMDNMPNWEWGVLTQLRDIARGLRNDLTRSQSQSMEDPDLSKAEPQFNINNQKWMFPSPEKEYQVGLNHIESFLKRMVDPGHTDAQFFARADNLSGWLDLAGKRLGSLSQRLRSSVGQARVNTDLAGDSAADKATPTPDDMMVRTDWFKIDDVFFEARGTCWALLHLLEAIEADFSSVLVDKNALVSLRQIIRELEPTQNTVWSPMILNGRGFALVANHSLVMASYISRANAALIDLKNLLSQG